jgi:hypothetical protein
MLMVSPFGKKSTIVHPEAFQKAAPIILLPKHIVLALFIFLVMPLHALFFSFLDQNDETSFYH